MPLPVWKIQSCQVYNSFKAPSTNYKENMSEDKISVLHCNDKYWTDLLHVFLKGKTEIVPSLVKRILDLDARDEIGETALHKASLLLPLELVRCFIKEGADINAKTSSGATPLLYAARSGRRDVFDTLLDAGANVDYCCKDINTMLLCVSQNGWVDLLPSLVKRIPDLDARDKAGETALHQAAIFGAVEIVKCLVEEGANINAKGHKGATPLLYAAAHSRKDVFNLLLCAGANVNFSDRNERSVLHLASENGSECLEMVQSLVKRVQDLNSADVLGKTALHIAALCGHLEIVKCLVGEGADINARSRSGATPLLYATAMGHRDVFDLLFYAGTNVNFCDNNGRTVLHYALKFGWLDEALSVVKQVHDLDLKDMEGKTALHLAAGCGLREMVKCLVEEGADINVETITGATPLLHAAANGRREIFDLLLNTGANVDGCCYHKGTVLHYASMWGWLDVVQSIVKGIPDLNKSDMNGKTGLHNASIDINARNTAGETALLIACRYQHLNIVECLIHANANCGIADLYGHSPLRYLIKKGSPNAKLVKLFIESVPVILPADYELILNTPLLNVQILQDIKFCCRVIVNKFNNHDLPKLYNLPLAGSLPRIEELKIGSRSQVFQAIQRTVRFEIETEGHCIQLKANPIALNVLCVKSLLEYYDKKYNCKFG